MRDECRRVKTSQGQEKDEQRQVKKNKRRVQESADECKTSAILLFMKTESPTVFTLKRTCQIEIKPFLGDSVLCVLIFHFLIDNTNVQFMQHDNAQATEV